MTIHELMIHPSHCFCEIATEELQFWAHKRYREHIPTMELLHSTEDRHAKEVISMIDLLELDDDSMLRMMEHVEMPEDHIINCCHHTQQILQLKEAC
jgi:hypothetical protein